MPEAFPLRGLRIVVTRPRDQSGPLLDSLAAEGAQPIAFPTIEITPLPDLSPLDSALQDLDAYDWVIFTSMNGVRITWQRLEKLGLPAQAFTSRRVAAIGPATAASLEARGVRPAFVPEVFLAERVAEGLGDVRGLQILIPRAQGARSALPDELTRRGAQVEEIAIYRSLPAEPDREGLAKLAQGVDVITFTSPSTVRGFVQIAAASGLDTSKLPRSPVVACIGPITADAASEMGYEPAIVAHRHTAEGLVEALAAHYAKER